MAQNRGKKTEVVSVSMPMQLREDIIKYADKRETSVSQVVNDAVKSYLLLEQWEEVRRVFVPAALRLGIKSEEDVETFFK